MKIRRDDITLIKRLIKERIRTYIRVFEIERENKIIASHIIKYLGLKPDNKGSKLIKTGVVLIVMPIPIVSEVIGAVLILIGLVISALFYRTPSIRQIPRDLRKCINFIKDFSSSLRSYNML